MNRLFKKKCPTCNAEIIGLNPQDLDVNYNMHMEQQHKVSPEVNVITDDKEPVVEEQEMEDMTKDELNDFAAGIGLTDEIKGYWNKNKIIKTLKKLLRYKV